MSERHVAINDTWIPVTGQGGKFVKMGEIIDGNTKKDMPPQADQHFKKVPNEIRDREQLGKFVQVEHSKYEAEKRQKRFDTARDLNADPKKFGA